jgi:16S rRNA (guanine(966)-N(2))-methyltransferase RsmD
LRIISGKYRSRKINSPADSKDCSYSKKSSLRPTSDRARESLFNILFNIIDFDRTQCLDLFAGTGAFGFESISRGAEKCDFVDVSRKSSELIERTSKELVCEDKVKFYREDALSFMKRIGKYYDIVFADPPYLYDEYEELVSSVLAKEFSIFVIESGRNYAFKYDIKKYDIIERKIGITNFKIFITKENDSSE